MNIIDIAKKLNISSDDIICYGNDKAKLKLKYGNKTGKVILVTAINPTPFGEGKTTVSIALDDALCSIGKKSLVVLREPSMGPVFGLKGGATGGGLCRVIPGDDINLHFTGDFHAITSANNLICAAIDNHIFQGNSLDIVKVVFNRCLDVNDRALRNIKLSNRSEKFNITAASEIMALFCLASSYSDLRERLGNIIVGYNSNNKEVFVKDLKLEDALLAILKDAFLPNLVQTLEDNPAIIHGGPFANIAHGCNSLVATKLASSLADYVVLEAGFGADLGAEKFFDIKCRVGDLKPSCSVLVCTVKALKYNAGVKKENILKNDVNAVSKGLCNLEAHITNLKKYGIPFIVALNKFDTDSDDEIKVISDYCSKNNILFSICDSYANGSLGSLDLANRVVDLCNTDNNFKCLYDSNISIFDKINTICKEIYHCSNVIYSDNAKNKINDLNNSVYKEYPICISKTQYSLSDDPSLLGSPINYDFYIDDIELYNGARFIVALSGKILRMPGLPKKPNYENIVFDDNYNINNLK